MKTLALACALLFTSILFAQTSAPTQPAKTPVGSPTNTHKVTDFAFMTGRWVGHFPGGKLTSELICSDIRMDEMMCQFRLNTPEKFVLLEFYTLRQTATGVEEIGRTFDADLGQNKDDVRLLLYPIEVSKNRVAFAGPAGSVVQLSALDLKRNKSGKVMGMHGHIIHSNGVVDVDWVRTPYEAPLK